MMKWKEEVREVEVVTSVVRFWAVMTFVESWRVRRVLVL